MQDHPWIIVGSQETPSKLRSDLNKGVASLLKTDKSWFRPHLCLNQSEGIQMIDRIARAPDDADTSYSISERVNYGGHDGMWLNLAFFVSLLSGAKSASAHLSPQQTSYIVSRLPEDSRHIVIEKVKRWYLESFLVTMAKQLDRVTKQVTEGDLLVQGTHDNRVFDLHHPDRIGHDQTPYSEWDLIGGELFMKFFFGPTLFNYGQDGFEAIDEVLRVMEGRRTGALDAILPLFGMKR